MKRNWSILLISSLLITATAFASPPQEAKTSDLGIDLAGLPEAVKGFEGVTGGVFKDGRLYIAGQPDEEALRRFHELGATVVVNLRTPGEMDDRDRVPFDEAALLGELGMEYVHIPLGGEDHPYTPEAVAAFAETLEKHNGPVLMHCTIGWRASYLWAAYLILYQEVDFSAALDRGEAIAISPPPLEGLLGRPLSLVYEE